MSKTTASRRPQKTRHQCRGERGLERGRWQSALAGSAAGRPPRKGAAGRRSRVSLSLLCSSRRALLTSGRPDLNLAPIIFPRSPIIFFGERARDGNKATCGNEIMKSTEAICLCSRCASSRSLLSDGRARSMQFPTWLAGPAQYQARRTYRRIAAASGLRSLLVLSIGKLVPKSLHLSRLLLSINWQTILLLSINWQTTCI